MSSRDSFFVLFSMLFMVCIYNVAAQNLVKNPSFESFVNCPKKLGNLDDDVIDWKTPTLGSTDYFNGCSKAMGTPKNFNGEQPANFGVGYVGFYFYAPDDYREYIEATLDQTLIKGETYTVSFYISLAERSDYAVKEFGIQFTENPIVVVTKKNLGRRQLSKISGDTSNYLEIVQDNFYADKEEWMLVETEFIANGTENYMLIGNFKTNDRTQKLRTKRNITKGAYYYLDMVSVVPFNSQAHAGGANVVDQKSFQLDSIHTFKNLLFRFDTAALLSKSKTELDEIEGYLSLHKTLKIEISGHTDSMGNAKYNRLLSENRAKAVASYFIEKGIDSTRITYKGYGSERPVMKNTTSSGRGNNRRVEFRIVD
jgi:outer membrane protein OmpA-like peptidoglycan-associated protein